MNDLLSETQQDEYREKLAAMGDDEFLRECFGTIDHANGYPTYSVFDQRASLCCAEGRRSGRIDIYQRAFKAAFNMAKGDQYQQRAWNALMA
jgi:hypothetical protein